jgi:hypothetical protein
VLPGITGHNQEHCYLWFTVLPGIAGHYHHIHGALVTTVTCSYGYLRLPVLPGIAGHYHRFHWALSLLPVVTCSYQCYQVMQDTTIVPIEHHLSPLLPVVTCGYLLPGYYHRSYALSTVASYLCCLLILPANTGSYTSILYGWAGTAITALTVIH